ncbi:MULTISPECIES: helix-turn-helix domain-containing protein [unclassified Carboxylicivirga]|uniref:helix-turn-helix domain-containing protein n=1 Tax=Carboxylicivirga TaxID=1628153 RepID=UPI003D33A75E
MNTENKKLLLDLITTDDLRQFRKSLLSDIEQILKENIKPKTKTWLKSNEAKALLEVSNGTLQNLRNNGTLPFTKVGGVIYYNRDDIQKMLLENKQSY